MYTYLCITSGQTTRKYLPKFEALLLFQQSYHSLESSRYLCEPKSSSLVSTNWYRTKISFSALQALWQSLNDDIKNQSVGLPRSKNDPTTAAEQTLAAAQKSQYFTSGLTQRCEILHSVAQLSQVTKRSRYQNWKRKFISIMVNGSFCSGH